MPLSSQQKSSLDGNSTTSLDVLLGSTRLRSVYSHSYLVSAQCLTLEHLRSLWAAILKGLSVVSSQPRIHSLAVRSLLFWEEEKDKSKHPSFVFDKVEGKHAIRVWVKWLPVYQPKELKV